MALVVRVIVAHPRSPGKALVVAVLLDPEIIREGDEGGVGGVPRGKVRRTERLPAVVDRV